MKTETITKSNNLTLDFLLTDNQSGSLNQVKPTGILDLFQTIAGAHAAVLGVSMTDLMKNGKCWVLESVQYDVIKPADPHERVYVETRFQIPGKLFYVRDYVIKNADGEVLVKGLSRWLVIEVATRRPVLNAIDYGCEGVAEDQFATHSKIRTNFDGSVTLGNYQVRCSETDIVGHLNNTRYADIIFDFFPKALKSLQIDYVKECKVGERLEIKSVQDAGLTFVEGSVFGERRFVAKLQF